MNKRRYVFLFIALLVLLEMIHPASTFAAWSKPDPQLSKKMNGVTRGTDRFVAVGDSGALYYSLDNSGGQFSSSVVTGTSASLNDIIYADGKYVMVGGAGTILTWVPGHVLGISTSDTSNILSSIAHGGGKYVATGQFGTVVTSSDAVTWDSQILSGAGGSYMYGVTYGDKFVTVGQHGEIWSSLDGVSWTERISNTSNYLQAVTYGNGQYVAVGTTGTVVTSPDGMTWTVQTSGITQSLGSITYGNGRYVAVGFGGTIMTSSDGVSWKRSASGVTDFLLDIQYGNNTFMVVGDNMNLVYENSTVTYHGNGNTGGTGLIDSSTYGIGASATVLGKGSLEKTGYTFAGWNTAVNGSGTSYAPGSTLTLDMANVTLYAKWTLNPTYTVTYNGNGSTGGAVPTDIRTYETGTSVTVLGNGSLARTGYTFAGWNTAANGSGTSYAAGATFAMGSVNTTLYAKWTLNPTYTVTYNGNGSTGGTVPTDSGTYETGTSVTVLGNGSLARTSYTFAGWNTAANGSGTNYAAGAMFAMGSVNTTLYAQWTLSPTYTVAYNGNGSTGGAVPTDIGTYETGESVTVLSNGSLVRTGYTFAGWNTAANGSGTNYAAGAALTMGNANVTLYAKWTLNPTYTVTYNGNSSTGGAVPTDIRTYETGTSVTVLGNGSLARTGYTFAGWNTAANGSGTSYAAGATFAMGSVNTTLYAKWTLNPTYTVTYNGNSSTGGAVPTDIRTYETGTSVTVLGNGSLARTGYTFAGWNTAANGSGTSYAAGATFAMGSVNTTLYAKWTLSPTYTVTYNGNGSTGGTVPTDSGTYETGEFVTVLGKGSLVRTDYTFAGWNTAANGSGTSYAAGATFAMGSANVTLYAQWTLSPTYTVTYNGNGSTGGTVPTDSGTYETGTSVTVLGNGSLARTGYTFAGWNTAANGSGTSYAAGATFAMGSVNMTLYAQWSANISSGGPSIIKVVSTDGKLTLPAGAIGEVSFENDVKIFIPSGAIDKELKITIKRDLEIKKLLIQQMHPVSDVFEISKNIVENFKKWITISFAFEPSKLAEGQQPGVFYFDETKKAWVEVAGGKIDGSWISVEVNHLAKFAVLCVESVNGQRVPCGPLNSSPISEFNDISGHWAAINIKLAVNKGIVSGYPDGTFRPNAAVTRAEFVVMLMNALKPKADMAHISFTDSAKIAPWAKEAVARAVQAGIIEGFEDSSFRPNKAVTRLETVVMIARALDLKADVNSTTGFVDDHQIPNWAKGAVAAMKNSGLVRGKSINGFAPNDKTTRAEAATILLRMLEQKNM